MLGFIDDYLLTPYVQVVLFVVLVGLFWLQHRKFKLATSGFSWVRTLILLALFLYFGWNWTTSISQAIARFSILGMFFINLNMIYNLLLGSLDEKYRLSLDAYARDIANKNALAKVWSSGKNYIYSRYFFDSLFSGYNPANFLKAVVNRQIPADIETVFAKLGVHRELVTHRRLLNFLIQKLDQSQELPQQLRDLLAQVIKQFDEHAWIQEQVDEFLQMALKDPEKLYHDGLGDSPPKAN
jgi:hypothetical protein